MDPLMLLHSQPFRTRDALVLVTPDVLRGPSYRQLMRGAHQVAEDEVDHGRQIQAFRATHDDPFILLGRSAAWAQGVRFAEARDPVVVAIPSHHRLARTAQVIPHLARLSGDEVIQTPFGLATSYGRTAVDLARGIGSRRRALDERVADVDHLLRETGLTTAAAQEAVLACAGLHGIKTARQVLQLCRDGVDSRPETRLRLLLGRAGFPDPVTQCPVMLPSGRVVARLDLGWPELMLGCEYDGEIHTEARQIRADLRRHNLVREAEWVVLQVDKYQMRRPEEIIEQFRSLFVARSLA